MEGILNKIQKKKNQATNAGFTWVFNFCSQKSKILKTKFGFGMETNFLIVFVCVYDLRWQNVDGFCYYSTIYWIYHFEREWETKSNKKENM